MRSGAARVVPVVLLFASALACHETNRLLGVPEVRLSVTDTTCPTARVGWSTGEDVTPETVDLPWTRDFGSPPGLILVLVATRTCEDGGTITVEILADGDSEDRESATGPQATAAVSASFF